MSESQDADDFLNWNSTRDGLASARGGALSEEGFLHHVLEGLTDDCARIKYHA